MKVAIVYDRVNKWGGAERVLLALHDIFPDAPLYTAVYDSKKAPWARVFPEVKTSFLQKLPFLRSKHEWIPFLMPFAFETMDFSGYDLVISVTSEAAKGIITKPPTRHICYCLTPTRYLWSHYKIYFKGQTFKGVAAPFVNYLRRWDYIAGQRPDKMIAISSEVKKRIKRYYGRDSEVIFPPVGLIRRRLSAQTQKGDAFRSRSRDYFLIVSRLVPYKRVDLAIKAFNILGYPLVVIGSGSEERKLKSMAKNNIKFVKNLTDEELTVYYHNTGAFVMPQNEDFGMAAVEVQSVGVPVIAYRAGGALDIVVNKSTGIFFNRQNVKSLIEAIELSGKVEFNKRVIIKNAQRFNKDVFKEEIKRVVDRL